MMKHWAKACKCIILPIGSASISETGNFIQKHACLYIVSYIFPHARGGKNSLFNSLFCVHFKHHDGGAPVRLLHASDLTYCSKLRPKKTRWLKHYAKY